MPKLSLVFVIPIVIVVALISFGIGLMCSKPSQQKAEKKIVSVTEPVETKTVEEKTADPFEDKTIPSKFYRIEGKNILAPDGKPVRLRGVSLRGTDEFSAVDVQDLKEMGVNCILYMHSPVFVDNKYKQGSFSIYAQKQIKMFTDAGIGVILLFNNNFWGENPHPDYDNEIIASWKEIFEKFGDNPGIIGWKIYRTCSGKSPQELYGNIITGIRKLDPYRPIFLESAGTTKDFLYDDPNLVYQFGGISESTIHVRNTCDVPISAAWYEVEIDSTVMKRKISALEESEVSWMIGRWMPRGSDGLRRELTDIFMLLHKVMTFPDRLNKNSPQYDPVIWNDPMEWAYVCAFDDKGNELKQSTFEISETQIPECVQRQFLFKDKKIIVRGCFDPDTKLVIYRVEMPYADLDGANIGFSFPKEADLPKFSVDGNRATFDTTDGQTLVGWNDKTKLTSPVRKELKVIHAKWGIGDRWSDVTEKVRSLIVNNTLDFPCAPSFLNAPHNGTHNNSIELTYSLDGVEQTVKQAQKDGGFLIPYIFLQVQSNKCARFNIEKQQAFEFVVAKGLKSLPEKLPTFDEVVKKQSR